MTGLPNLRADLHVRVRDWISDNDRAWFRRHPLATMRHRPAEQHELCDPRHWPACVTLGELPATDPGFVAEWWMEVEKVAPGVRARRPYWIVGYATDAA